MLKNSVARTGVYVKIDNNILKRLDKLSEDTGLNRGEMIRNAVTEYVLRMETALKIRKEMRKLVETVKCFTDEDLIDLYSEISKEVSKRGLLGLLP